MDPARFGDLMRGDPAAVPLDRAAVAIAAALRPGLDEQWVLGQFDDLAESCPAPSIEALVRHLFVEGRFTGNRADYYDWRNSCLDHVLEARTGIPITLSIVTVEVGRRLDLPLTGVGMPAHFLVGSLDDPDLFVDAFDGGMQLDRAAARRRFGEMTNDQMSWDDGYLDPTPARAVVVRMLNNLGAIFGRRRDAVRLAIVTQLRMMIPELAAEHDEAVRNLAVLN